MPSKPADIFQADGGAVAASAHMAKRLQVARSGVLLLLALALVSAYLTRHCLAAANTAIQGERELEFDNRQFGYLYARSRSDTFFFKCLGVGLDNVGDTRVTMPLLSLLWSGATLATALVTTLPALLAARFALGLAQAGLIPNQAKVVNDWFPATSRGATSAVIVTAMSVGSVVSLWLTSWLMRFYEWRTVLVGYSLVGVVWAVLFFVLFRSRPADVRWLRSDAETDRHEEIVDIAADPAPAPLALLQILACRNIWGLAGQLLFKTAGYNLLVTFFPAFLEYAFGTAPEDAGMLTSWALIALVFGSLLGGRLIDYLQRRTGNKRISRCGVAIAALLLTSLFMFAASLAVTDHQSAAIMAVAAFFSGMALPCPWAAVVDIGGRNSAIVMGYVNVGSCLAGILISPEVGRLMDHLRATHGNWNLVIYVHAAFYLAAACCWLAVNPEMTIEQAETRDAV